MPSLPGIFVGCFQQATTAPADCQLPGASRVKARAPSWSMYGAQAPLRCHLRRDERGRTGTNRCKTQRFVGMVLVLLCSISQGGNMSIAGVGVALDRVSHRYGAALAVEDVSLDIAPRELVALLGPSGCGKTTLLRIAAGLLAQTEGDVRIGAEVVNALPPNERGAGIVFQNYALFPHMTVEANIA